MIIDKNAAAALAASLNSPPGVRTNESRPITVQEAMNLEKNLEEAGDIMLQSTIPTADDLLDDDAPIVIGRRNKRSPGPKAMENADWDPFMDVATQYMVIHGTLNHPSGSMKGPWSKFMKWAYYGENGEPGPLAEYEPSRSENPESKFRTAMMAGIKKRAEQCDENTSKGELATTLQLRCHQMLKAQLQVINKKKRQAAVKALNANNRRRINESEETDLGLRNRMRGVSAPAGPSGPDVSDAVAVLGVQPTSGGKLDTSILDSVIGKFIVLLFV